MAFKQKPGRSPFLKTGNGLPSPLNMIEGKGNVLGYYEDSVITLNKKLKVGGVPYHEAFHAIFRLAITNEKRSQILAAARDLYGAPKEDFNGLYIEHEGKKVSAIT